MEALRKNLNSHVGQSLAGQKVVLADEFSYTDPVDGSKTEGQGIRIGFDNQSRIVYRLSGTGTEGATLRVYIERHEPNPELHNEDPQTALSDLIQSANSIAGIREHTNRTFPSVITWVDPISNHMQASVVECKLSTQRETIETQNDPYKWESGCSEIECLNIVSN